MKGLVANPVQFLKPSNRCPQSTKSYACSSAIPPPAKLRTVILCSSKHSSTESNQTGDEAQSRMFALLTAGAEGLITIWYALFPSRMGRSCGKVKKWELFPRELREASLFTSVSMKTRGPTRVKQLKTRHQPP